MKKFLRTAFLFFLFPLSAWAGPLSFTVNMSEAVTVGTGGGTPRIAVNVGGVTRYASYAGGTGTSALTFTYTPQAGDVDLDGVAVSSPVDLNGGTITDLSGNAISNLTFTPPNTANVKVDYPSLSMDFIANDYILSGTHYGTLSSFLTAAGGSFTRGSIGTYFDSSGTLQTAGNNVARFDYDPTTLQAKGILIEESRANGVRNNTMQGAVVGTPGTLPTNWSWTGANGLSVSVSGIGSDHGLSYIDVRFFGTTSTAGPRGVMFNSSTSCTAVPSGKNSISAYMKIQSGSTTNINLWYLIAGGLTSGGASTGEYRASNPSIGAGSLSQQRYVSTLTFTNVATAAIFPYLELYPTGSGVPIDVTVRIGMPQCEQGAFATSVIPTTNAAVTRADDSFGIPTGAWYNQAAGTAYQNVAWQTGSGTSYPMLWRFDDTTINNRWNAFIYQGTPYIGFDGVTGGVNQGGASTAVGFSGSAKNAAAQEFNNTRSSVDGVLKTLDLTWNVPTVTQLKFYQSSANRMISSFKYYPTRVSDTQLQLLTQ